MRKIFAFIFAVTLGLGVPAAAQGGGQDKSQVNVQDDDALYAAGLIRAGEKAPDFSLGCTDGSSISLNALKGKYVLIDFWATWCPDCRKITPQLKALHERYGNKVAFIGISFDRDDAKLAEYLKANGITWPQHREKTAKGESALGKAFGVKWIPAIYLIDPSGKVVLSTVVVEKVEAELERLSAADFAAR